MLLAHGYDVLHTTQTSKLNRFPNDDLVEDDECVASGVTVSDKIVVFTVNTPNS